ncbi:MAG: BMP family ABC transporter substrate-binding protein [Oscillospiraceae bacterium]|jgi:basic membrane protein A|nr:BMP family ABC transporter substrate-binding protein [Oscillospiraceae bacterium]MBQ1805339.1 BMP family ABC transporter substrate-binding protein [Oscillospiraceae bacterium]MBQ2323107.1 BMP family ABC transporter substrate-binding protein [Oscillospiraceae bacterium]MBQ5567228.1 BMP family ABC transporter substrate-binding protein [Oscillospiraceae bacterium]
MKKFLALLLALVMMLSLAACGKKEETPPADDQQQEEQQPQEEQTPEVKDIKVGFITLHDENSTYDLNFINAAKEACANLGIPESNYIIRTNVPEGQECYEEAAALADSGCSIIFADSFGHEDYMIQAAKEFPDVQFCHSTGTKAHTEGLPNYHNAFASIYEGRYLAGIAAGMKLNEMIADGKFTPEEAKIGYVGAFTYAEVVSGYTSFFLGARSVCPTATMEVTFTGSWYDETAEKEGANKLIGNGCKLISQHADSMGAPTACETAGIPDVSYNGSTKSVGPNTYIISSRINWVPYYEYAIKAVMDGTSIDTDYTGTIATESVQLTELNDAVAAAGTAEAIEAAMAELNAGTRHVFDTSTFTVDGAELTSYLADVDSDAAYTPDTEVIADGYFHESEYRSAPYFDLQIDGITLLDTAF